MKRLLKLVMLCLLSSTALAERNYENFFYLENNVFVPSTLAGTVVAFDPEEKEWIWKNYSAEDADWKVINHYDLDKSLQEDMDVDTIKKLAAAEGVGFKVRKIGDDVGLDVDFKLKGGGPCLAAACGIVCKIIMSAGCGAGAFAVGVANPGIGVLYAAVCTALDGAGTAGCITTCLAVPCP